MSDDTVPVRTDPILRILTDLDPGRDVAAAIDAAALNGQDPLLDQLRAYARQRDTATEAIRRLLAYARTQDTHRLKDLAEAAGLTTSGVRTAYDANDVQRVLTLTGVESHQTD